MNIQFTIVWRKFSDGHIIGYVDNSAAARVDKQLFSTKFKAQISRGETKRGFATIEDAMAWCESKLKERLANELERRARMDTGQEIRSTKLF